MTSRGGDGVDAAWESDDSAPIVAFATRGDNMRLPAFVAVATLLSSFPAHAEKVAIGCPLIEQYSEDQVHYLLSEARSVIGEQETGRIYGHYLGLRNACRVNGNAVRVVTVSPTLRAWLAQNGVDISLYARRM
jgi:hypothetical protein